MGAQQNKLALAISITSKAFEGVLDKSGKPYIMHCIRVMNHVNQNDEDLMIIAVMHDLLEDVTTYTAIGLQELGFSERVIKALLLLKHDPGVDYFEYIKQIATNEDARLVKLSDLRDNSDITRLKGLRKKDLDRIEQYHRAWIYLSN